MSHRSNDVDAHTALLLSTPGKAVVAVLMMAMSTWIVVPNMPDSAMQGRVDALWYPARQAGFIQDWGVFSPNPRSQSIDVRALVEHDDGSVEFWDIPDFDPVIGAYREYRWNKWQERVRLDSREKLWEPTAEWIADQYLRDGVRPRRVTLIRRWIDHEPLGNSGGITDGGWNEFSFYIWERDS